MTAGIVEAFFRNRTIEFARTGDGGFSAVLAGENKHSIPLAMAVRADGLRLESFFMRAPLENREQTYRLLLSRNVRARGVWFAVDADGDVYLLGHVAVVTEDELDRIVGELLTTADEMFVPALSLGFAEYLAADLAWREKQSHPA